MACRTKSSGQRPLLQPEHLVPNNLRGLWCALFRIDLHFQNLLEKVAPTVELAVPGVALFTEHTLAFTALHTLHVPGFVQDFHQIALHDRLLAAATHERGHRFGSSTDQYYYEGPARVTLSAWMWPASSIFKLL